MRHLITLLVAAAALSMLAVPALADDHYPVEVAPIIVERPEAPGAIPPAAPPSDAVAPAVGAPAAGAPAVDVPAPAQVGLARTGLDITVGLLLALGLGLAGGAALLAARRRHLLAPS